MAGFDPSGSGANRQQADVLGLPMGFKAFTPAPFGGMNQMASRIGIEDSEFWWMENLYVAGPLKITALDDNGPALYTAPLGKTIISFFWFNINATRYCAVFLDDGTAVQVAESTGAQTVISSAANTFYTTGAPLPACAQSASQYLIISSNITTNSYWIWDGATLYSAGGLAPTTTIRSGGAGYSSVPTVTVYGGHGTGATATATVNNGAVVEVVITNPGSGYTPNDRVQLIFSGGGSDTGGRLRAVLTGVAVDHVALLDGGSGYTSAPAVNFSSGAATATATVSGGKVVAITLTSGGAAYTDAPTVTFSGGGGSGAAAYALLVPTSVASGVIDAGGSGYTSAPTVTVVGGGGSGATFTTTVAGGAINTLPLGAGGSGYTSAPAIVIGTGFNSGAAADAALMPYGVSGAAIEIYSSRVWVVFPNQSTSQNNAGVFLVSAPSSLTDFAESDGGASFVNADRFLKVKYTAIRQSNGFLYPFGDSSVSVISNVQTGGSPTTTTFNYQNTDPQVGTPWRDSCADFGRTVLFANKLGVFGVYGGTATKVSEKVDDVFDNMVLPEEGGVTPSTAVVSIQSNKVYLILLTILDPLTAEQRTVMLGWDSKKWFVVSQSAALTYIGGQEVDSVQYAWGTDGTSLYPLLDTTSSTLEKKLVTKLYGAKDIFLVKQALAFYMQAHDQSGSGASFTVTVDNDSASYALPVQPSFGANLPDLFAGGAANVSGVSLGMTLISTSPNFRIEHLVLGYIDQLGLIGH